MKFTIQGKTKTNLSSFYLLTMMAFVGVLRWVSSFYEISKMVKLLLDLISLEEANSETNRRTRYT